jgi:trehalose 6-phosphate phosphatase
VPATRPGHRPATAWPEVERRVAGIAATPGRLLVVADFDGTLSEITSDPMGAVIDPLARRALRRLAAVAHRRPNRLVVAVLSGRTASDVAGRVRVGGVRYLGNHGNEEGWLPRHHAAERLAVELQPALRARADAARTLGAAVAAAVAARIGSTAPPDWLFVEDKGPAVAFHYRNAPNTAEARAIIDAALDDAALDDASGGLLAGYERHEGRRVVELQPDEAGDKGIAARRLIRAHDPAAVLVMGDDRSDALAFRAASEAQAAGDLAVLNVAVHGASETPPDVAESADIMLERPRQAARVLMLLARDLEGSAPVAPDAAAPDPA